MAAFFVGRIFITPAQIFEYGAREKHVLLEHDSYLVSESVHVVFTHIVASDDYRAGVCVVETAYQVYEGRFRASGSSYDADGLTGFYV